VELFLDVHAGKDTVVLDPFVGSGTTLFEAARRDLACYGTEVNPAAVLFAGCAKWACVPSSARARLLGRADDLVRTHLDGHRPVDLFSVSRAQADRSDLGADVRRLLRASSGDELLFGLLAASLMLAMGDDPEVKYEDFERVYRRTMTALSALPHSRKPCDVFAADARQIPLPAKRVDLIITSPPYINVFNYHQNYRKAVELMGWHGLAAAPSEIGANRKHRGNRFMTVVQYAIDMLQVLQEMRRVLRPEGTVVITIGRESNVRGVAFKNGQILAMLASGGAGFEIERWQERRFTNRFGEGIFEDLLTLRPAGLPSQDPVTFGREVGGAALAAARRRAEGEARADLEGAIAVAHSIQPSPIYAHQESRIVNL
jgi:SAM-dependent methyltransferase